jgi:hypothetical protein
MCSDAYPPTLCCIFCRIFQPEYNSVSPGDGNFPVFFVLSFKRRKERRGERIERKVKGEERGRG